MTSVVRQGMRTDKLDPEIGRRLGWDMAVHGVALPAGVSGCPQEGFLAARNKMACGSLRHQTNDRYVRKVLQLRLNAWRRGRIFDEKSVTPKFIQDIDRIRCPITREKLTHSTGALSDWSIDRLRNDGGYFAQNITVMSARANIAKGQMTYREVQEVAAVTRVSGASYLGMDPRAWARMHLYSAYAERISTEEALQVPMVVLPPMEACTWNTALLAEGIIRDFTLFAITHPNPRKAFGIYLVADFVTGKKAHKCATTYISRLLASVRDAVAHGSSPEDAVEDVGYSQPLRDSWAKLCREIDEPGLGKIITSLRNRTRRIEMESMGMDTKGYVTPEWVAKHDGEELAATVGAATRRAARRP